jgi:hypothetical protein
VVEVPAEAVAVTEEGLMVCKYHVGLILALRSRPGCAIGMVEMSQICRELL